MIHAKLITDKIVQVGDMTRFNAGHSLINEPIVGYKFILVGDSETLLYEGESPILDYVFKDDGEKEIKLVIVAEETEIVEQNEVNKEYSVSNIIGVLNEEQDNLFSSDDDILSSEPDLYRFLPEGRSSCTYAHREAQSRILAWLDEQKIWNAGKRYKKEDIKDIEEFRHWSRFFTLHIIFNSLVVEPDDLFEVKAKYYLDLMLSARQRAAIKLGKNNEVVVDRVSSFLVRR